MLWVDHSTDVHHLYDPITWITLVTIVVPETWRGEKRCPRSSAAEWGGGLGMWDRVMFCRKHPVPKTDPKEMACSCPSEHE